MRFSTPSLPSTLSRQLARKNTAARRVITRLQAPRPGGIDFAHSNNFCSSCNRLRITAEGRLLLCLGNEDSISLRDLMRAGLDDEALTGAIRDALTYKPERHVFDRPDEPQILRFMNASGG